MSGGFLAPILAGVAVGVGLCFDYRIPRPDMTAAAPALLAFDIAERQADEERYERLVTKLRLLRLAYERGGDQ